MTDEQFAQLLGAVNRLADAVEIMADASCNQASAAVASLEASQTLRPAPRITAVAPHKRLIGVLA